MGRALATALIAMLPACAQVGAPGLPQNAESALVKRVRQVFARVPATLAKNHKTFAVPDGVVSGFGAGEAYPQIWLRDSAWIVPAAASYYDAPVLTSWHDLHLAVAAENGRLRDWVAASSPETFREWAPQVSAVGPLADSEGNVERLAQRLLGYGIYEDAQGRMNRCLSEVGGGLLLGPQFTLAADSRKGARPSFSSAAPPELAAALFDDLVARLRARHGEVATGRFGAEMFVESVNHGPVTFWLEA